MSLTDEPDGDLTDQPTSETPVDTHEERDQEQQDTPTVWLIRAGRDGDRFDYNVDHGLACLGWDDLPDLRSFSSREELRDALRLHFPNSKKGTISSYTSQLWRMRTDVRLGDLVVMPRKGAPEIALGSVSREYWYDNAADVGWGRHVVSVDWKRTDVPRSALKQDLVGSLSAQMTICSITRNDAPWRIRQLLETGKDSGPRVNATDTKGDLSALVERFRTKSGYPTEAHQEQERLRAEWAEKLAPENIPELSRPEFYRIASHATRGNYQYVYTGDSSPNSWITEMSEQHYTRMLQLLEYLCWGNNDIAHRIEEISSELIGTIPSKCLAICHSDRFLPIGVLDGNPGTLQMLECLGLPAPSSETYGERFVEANDRLREHVAPYFDDNPVAIAAFMYWLMAQETYSGGGDKPDLSTMVEQFRAETDYPTEAHEEQKRLRAEWAQKLAPKNIADFSGHDLTGVASHGTRNRARYVYPYARGVLQWIRRLDKSEYSRLLDSIEYLCWGEDEAWVRYDQMTDRRSARRVRGFGDSTAIRLLAITHPKDFLPIGPRPGLWSRYTLLRRLGLQEPQGSSHGQRVVDGNNRLIEFLTPHFGDDTLEMGAFLEWLIKQKPPKPEPPVRGVDLGELAAELLIDDVDFLEDIVELLEDKGQVILYGPPGTGKTYLARKLAEELAPDDSCRALVQFHPSTSYEDFFEGFRPAGTGKDGYVRYELTHGPLARMAKQASKARDKRHVMIIDEINRANLPRVLGELLFLLEYRDESVHTLYRPDEKFSLPENLWFIGTMNTADRSIALVDAALRRRFHFVPFFPDSGPMAGLLARWLETKGEPAWVARLVDAVNNELTRALGGSDLLLGPSHFMKKYGAPVDHQREQLRRIWEYNIEPFIEDQFFGDPEQTNRFRFHAVWNRHSPPSGREADTGGDPRDSELGLASAGSGSDREFWTRRAGEFPPQDRAGDERHHAEIRQVVGRYVEFALDRGADPAGRNDQLVEEFLSSREPPYADKTKTDYRRHVSEWFDHAGADGGADAEPGSAQPGDE